MGDNTAKMGSQMADLCQVTITWASQCARATSSTRSANHSYQARTRAKRTPQSNE